MKLFNQQIIKNANMKRLYTSIYATPDISRAQLAKSTGLSKTTISTLVDELIERKFIQDMGTTEDIMSVGRKPNGLRILHGQHYVGVISWSQTEIQAKLVDICGFLVEEVTCTVTEADSYIPLSLKLLSKLNASLTSEQFLGVCIVVPGMIDLERQEIFTTMLNLTPQGQTCLLQDLQKLGLPYPITILNDTACAAYAEKIYTRIPQQDFAYINFQHGIGAALFIQGKLLGQATAFYTQFGHYSIDSNGPLCSCGNRGCLERMLGESAVRERLLASDAPCSLTQHDTITYRDLSNAALYGDLAAQEVIRHMGRDFSKALANLVSLVHPQLIIIGGKGKELGPLFLNEVLDQMNHIGFRRMMEKLQVRYSFLDSTAYFAGAMKYFFDTHYDFTREAANTFFIG